MDPQIAELRDLLVELTEWLRDRQDPNDYGRWCLNIIISRLKDLENIATEVPR